MREPKNKPARVQYGVGAGTAVAFAARHGNAPPIHMRLALLGSWANGVMNRKLPAGFIDAGRHVEKVAPPLVDRRIERPVVSSHSMFVLFGFDGDVAAVTAEDLGPGVATAGERAADRAVVLRAAEERRPVGVRHAVVELRRLVAVVQARPAG